MSSNKHFTDASVHVRQAPGSTDLHSQCLRVLRCTARAMAGKITIGALALAARCTARAMAGSPGGLRFKAGTRPWLEGLDTSPMPTPARAAC